MKFSDFTTSCTSFIAIDNISNTIQVFIFNFDETKLISALLISILHYVF